jgi:hypothetical protein
MEPDTHTHNNALAFKHSGDKHLEFFSKAGSLFDKKESYYGDESSALDLFKSSWLTGDYEISMKLLFWLRDIRGVGSGNRSGFRSSLKWLANDPIGCEWVESNIHIIPELGRWDDLKSLYDTPCEDSALRYWASALIAEEQSYCGLASKWANRQDYKLRNWMQMSPKSFRKMLVRNTKVVEQDICANKWDEVNYQHVPSVAMSRYKTAFNRHDSQRFDNYRKSLVKVHDDGTTELTGKVNAGALFPHDIVRMLLNEVDGGSYGKSLSDETKRLAEGQFLSLPNFYDNVERRIMPFVDCSGSMESCVSGEVTAMAIALGLGLYCSDRLGKDNHFYRIFMPFSDHAKFESWDRELFADAIVNNYGNGYCGSTNINSAFELLLERAEIMSVPKEQMPNVIVILSDQQFDYSFKDNNTPVNSSLERWVKAGFDKPEIIYWNLAGYKNSPATMHDKDVSMLSGFSPSILKSFLSGDKLDPISVMLRTLNDYNVIKPQK